MKDLNRIAAEGVLFDGRYKLIRSLSSDGGTADVWLALDTNTIDEVYDDRDDRIMSVEETGIKVAIKIYRPKNALDLGEQRFREEFKIVFNCHHTNLVQPINFSIYEGIPYLVLPYCRNGSSETLQRMINDKDELWRYISDVSAGLAYLHAFNPTIVHHDIKPANILVDDSGNFAITDFGISAHRGLNREGYDDSHSGTMAYMAPERFSDDYQSIPESDIWSFGATLYELITGQVPFGEDGGLAQLEGNLTPPPLPPAIPHAIRSLITDCLSADVAKRPTAEYISRAAREKEYPVRNRVKSVAVWAGVAVAAIAAVVTAVLLLVAGDDKEVPPTAVPTAETRYAEAMRLMTNADADDLRAGLEILDSLGKKGYVPALYEQAFTYGWYSDSASVARKQLLGIRLYPENSPEGYLPRSESINRKATGLLAQIEDIQDSAYAEINALALYKLASYYYNTDKVFGAANRVESAEALAEKAVKWAEKSGNGELTDKINRNLKIIKENKTEDRR